ncbi:hypothetical protein [Naasia lichenicola]|uniref:Uncharacterized protein n=1 Tax=Naasia lichenicola TaxID=2565933 RepID=A0A4S4FMU3_9MICO|nr:hypothetical protein [Naasia lichenicola]THG30765.1 hypothetical protein E6C64_09000 [Naasia lichenicola]THG32002.1 hypothetical protein E6C64_08145 [Naasia lichenicola]
MDFWGVIAIVAVVWVAVSLVLGLGIGRAIRIAEVKETSARTARLSTMTRKPAREMASAA